MKENEVAAIHELPRLQILTHHLGLLGAIDFRCPSQHKLIVGLAEILSL
jgi:hypothetical protein